MPVLISIERPEEVVVDPRDLERREGRERRLGQRQDDALERGPDRRPVHQGSLVELLGQRLHVVAEHEGAEAQLERDVDDDDPDVLVVQRPLSLSGRGIGRFRYIRYSGVMMICGGSRFSAVNSISRMRLKRQL